MNVFVVTHFYMGDEMSKRVFYTRKEALKHVKDFIKSRSGWTKVSKDGWIQDSYVSKLTIEKLKVHGDKD